MIVDETVVKLGTDLAMLAVNDTINAVNTKRTTLKSEKSADKLRQEYDEIVSKLITERAEAILLAQTYKAELDRITISDDDITHLHNTLKTLVNLIAAENQEQYDKFLALVNKDTLKTMQLLGFNYKAAIGEPLTEICATKLKNWANSANKNQKGKRG